MEYHLPTLDSRTSLLLGFRANKYFFGGHGRNVSKSLDCAEGWFYQKDSRREITSSLGIQLSALQEGRSSIKKTEGLCIINSGVACGSLRCHLHHLNVEPVLIFKFERYDIIQRALKRL